MDSCLSSSTPNFTVATWLYFSGFGNNIAPIFSSRAASNGKGICIWITSAYKIRVDDGTNLIFNNYTLPLDTWVHICIVRTPTERRLYVNGVLTDTRTGAGDLSGIDTTCKIGVDNLSSTIYYTIGRMNDFRVYDHALSAREAKEISKGLMLHMPLAPPGGKNFIHQSAKMPTD